VTDDGYILNIWRIPGTLKNPSAAGKPPVLLQHGLNSDMMFWFVNTPELAPPFVLARAGYDVWLGNNRGNRYSSNHVKYSQDDKEYWNFSWEEMGTHDTPKVVETIKATTGVDKITYIGHSEGTT
jgi:pimeloyl-ACP methyl ester carboxylesterase